MIQRHVMDISWISLWRVLFFLIFVTILFLGQQILLGLFLAIVISAGLDFIIDFLENRGVPRSLGVVIIFLMAILCAAVLVYTVLPFLIADLNTIVSSFNRQAASYWLGPLVNFQPSRSLSIFFNRISGQLFSGDLSPLSTFSDLIGGFGLAISVLISSFYLSMSRNGIERFIRAVFPNDYEEEALKIYENARRKIGFWFQTQILLSLILGFLVWISLMILGVKHALMFGFIAGLFEIVPFVGPIISGGIAIIAIWITSPILAFYTLLVFLVIHQFEANVLVPILTRRTVGLHPVIVIVALLIGLEISGLLGAFIAVPAAAVIQEIVEYRASRDRLTTKEESM